MHGTHSHSSSYKRRVEVTAEVSVEVVGESVAVEVVSVPVEVVSVPVEVVSVPVPVDVVVSVPVPVEVVVSVPVLLEVVGVGLTFFLLNDPLPVAVTLHYQTVLSSILAQVTAAPNPVFPSKETGFGSYPGKHSVHTTVPSVGSEHFEQPSIPEPPSLEPSAHLKHLEVSAAPTYFLYSPSEHLTRSVGWALLGLGSLQLEQDWPSLHEAQSYIQAAQGISVVKVVLLQ